jgi:hypothetical protein
MRQPSRRTFLRAATGTLLAGAGCLGHDGPRTTNGSSSTPTDPIATTPPSPTAPTVTDLGTERTVGDTPVTVSNLSVRDSVLTLDDDSMTLVTSEDERYVLVSVAGSDSGPASESFALVVDDDRYPGRVDVFGGSSVHDRGPTYDPSYGTDGGWVAFVVPLELDARESRVVVEHEGETAAWRLSDEDLERLRRGRARFELREVVIPERVTVGEKVSVRVAAENVADVPGTFRGVLNVANLGIAYAPYPFALDADPGETVVWEHTFGQRPPRAADSIGFLLDTVAGERETRATVEVETLTATTGTDETTAAEGTTAGETGETGEPAATG